MQNFNKNSYGETIYVDFGEDVSAGTGLKMYLEPQSGEELEVTPTLGTSDVTVGDGEMLANQYVTYATTEDMFSYIGKWRARASLTLSGSTKSTEYREFRVVE